MQIISNYLSSNEKYIFQKFTSTFDGLGVDERFEQFIIWWDAC